MVQSFPHINMLTGLVNKYSLSYTYFKTAQSYLYFLKCSEFTILK